MTKAKVALVLALILLAPIAAAAADDARTAAAGIRKVLGKRLTLYTDLSGRDVDELPAVFEQALPQWCAYFGVKQSDHADWHMTGFLMKDKARFAQAGLLPGDLPPFLHGYSRGQLLWLYEQPSEYYRRHLLLHEGTHGFMLTILGSAGPPWYMEGLAELMGTHRWRDGRLTLGTMPRDRDEVPEWGRIRIIQNAVAERRALRLKTVIEFPPSAHRETEPYAWCWAAATLLDRHPRYQQRFRQLCRYVRDHDFNQRFYKLFESDWQPLCEEWQLMVANMEYGYDVVRSAVDFTPGKPLERAAAATIAADRGWQNSGLRLEGGRKYRLTASGRYQVAREPQDSLLGRELYSRPSRQLGGGSTTAAPTADTKEAKIWWCEPGGVTIRYYQGRPLGILLAAVRPDQPVAGSTSALLKPTAIGLGATFSPPESGTLFLKINDSAGELDDNAGELKVEVRPST